MSDITNDQSTAQLYANSLGSGPTDACGLIIYALALRSETSFDIQPPTETVALQCEM